jgi:hypothetical protein
MFVWTCADGLHAELIFICGVPSTLEIHQKIWCGLGMSLYQLGLLICPLNFLFLLVIWLRLMASDADTGMVKSEMSIVYYLLTVGDLFCLIGSELSILICTFGFDPCWLNWPWFLALVICSNTLWTGTSHTSLLYLPARFLVTGWVS